MLNGRTALVVEEEFLIALDIQRMLETLGVEQTLFARTAEEAEQLRATWPALGLAIVEVRSHGTAAHRLVDDLRRDGIPTVLTTADVALGKSAPAFPDLAVVPKPLPEEALASAIREALAARR
jgi:CheY-like chemotaxis protein